MRRLAPLSFRSVATLLSALAVLSCGEAPTAPQKVELAVTSSAATANATASSLVISQIYGGGGNSGATYKNDFIEIFNPTASAISVTGWSVQYASATGTTWQVTNLTGSIPAGGYYLVQEAAGTGGTTNLPTPDATGSIAMSGTAGKVLLANTTTAQSGACPTPSATPASPAVIDIVGFGTGSCAPTTAGLSNTTAALRGTSGCTFSQLPALAADFSTGAPTPRNSASPANPCGGGGTPAVPASASVTPPTVTIVAGNTTTFSATALDASNTPVSTTFTWTSSDPTVATVNAAGTATGVAAGTATITATTSNNISATATITVTAPTITSRAGEIVISQINGGGGNANATFKNDYIELFNRTTQPVSVDGWSVQYASATGAYTQATPLTGTIPAGGYYLVAQSSGGATGADLPTAQATGTINMSATAGKVLLYQGTSPAGVACPTGNAVVDEVSFGSGTNCGTSTPTLSSTLAALRKSGGCYYTPDAATDFTTGTPAPRNASTAPRSCVVGPLDHVTVTGGLTVLVGASTQLTAVALDANDNIVPGAVITWSSANTSLATVNGTGLVTGVSANLEPVTITASATANGITKTGAVDVQVNTDGINWIDVSSSTTSFPPGFQTQIFFTARVQSGGTIIPADFTFEAVDPQYMTVQNRNNTAIVTGVSAPTDGTRPGIRVTATPKAGGTPYVFTSRSITIETPVVSPPTIYANNDEFGLPTPASAGSATDQLIRRPQMTISYNQDRGTPNWVSYELDSRHLVTGADRCNCFSADPNLPANKQIFTSDYTNGGYDRGHMARSADRTTSNAENASTFYLTNIVPQLGDLNQGVWAQFENQLADSARAGRAVYIITGPLYSAGRPLRYVNDSGKVAIPDSTWKVALIGPGNSGNPFTRSNITSWDDLAGLTLLTVNMPNIAGIRNDPPSKYYTTVDKIEASTGYDFLSLINAAYQPALDYKDHAPVARITTTGGTTSGAPITFSAATSSDSDVGRSDLGGRTEGLNYSWSFSDGSTATGVSVTKTFSTSGAFTATLTVTDVFGWPNSTTANVALTNLPPTATLVAPATATEGTPFSISLTGATDQSPTDAANLKYAFDCGTGYGTLGTASSTNCTAADNGSVTVKGKVVDPEGAFTEYTFAVAVSNVAPTATFTAPTSANRGSAITLALTAVLDPSSTDAAAGFTYAFDCGAGFADASTTATATCAASTSGTLTVRGKVADKDGGVSEYSASVQVISVPPTANVAAPTTVAEGDDITVTLSPLTAATPAELAALKYAFDCGTGYGAAAASATVTCPTTDNGTRTVKGKIIDTEGAFTEYTNTVTVTNVAPTATFAAPATVPRGAAITLSLTGATDVSTADVTAGFSYSFDCGAGFSDASTAATAICDAASSGAKTVRGRVTDKDGGSTDYTATVQVTPVPPTATIVAPTSGVEGTAFTVSLTAPTAATEAELGLLKYAFDCGTGYGALSASSTANCTPADNGARAVRGKVVDSEGAFTEYTASVAVSNVAPTASFSAPSTAARGSNVALSFANVVDPSTADAAAGFSYSYDCGTGYGAATSSPTGSCTPASSGSLAVRGKVSDKDGGSTEYNATITVTPVAPTATFVAPASVNEGSAIALSLAGARGAVPAETPLLKYQFDCGTGYGTLGSTSSASCPTTDNGTRTVRAKIVDSEGAFTEYTATVGILNVAPTASFTAPATAERGLGFAVSFANGADASSADVTAGLKYAFDCGTGYGAAASTTTATCGFASAGVQTVRGRVTDKDGGVTEYTASITITTPILALVRRAPTLNGRIEGNVQMMNGENVTFNSGGAITGKLYVPGLPTVRQNGTPTFGGTVDGIGAATPSGYTVTLNSNATLGTLARRFDAIALPTVAAPRNTTGTRSVSLNRATDAVGDWATVKSLTVNGNIGTVALPAGAYEEITVNGSGNVLTLGVAGSTTPTQYDIKHLTLNGNATLNVVGPVVITMSEDLEFSGVIGQAGRYDLLTLRFSKGNVTLNGNATLHARVVTPSGRVTINGGSFTGALAADGLTLNGNAIARIVGAVTP